MTRGMNMLRILLTLVGSTVGSIVGSSVGSSEIDVLAQRKP